MSFKNIPTVSTTLRAAEGRINQVKTNRDGDLIFTCGMEAPVAVWNAMTGERLGTYVYDPERPYDPEYALQQSLKSMVRTVSHIDVNVNSTELAATQFDSVLIFDVQSGRLLDVLRTHTTAGATEFNQYCKFSDKILVALTARVVVSQDFVGECVPEVQLYQCGDPHPPHYGTAPRGWTLVKSFTVPVGKPNFVHWGPCDSSVICGTDTGHLLQWDLDGNLLHQIHLHKDELKCASFNKLRSVMLTVGRDKRAFLLNTVTFEVIRVYQLDRPLNACSLSPLIDAEGDERRFHALLAGGQNPNDVTTSRQEQGFFESIILNLMTGQELGRITAHYSPTLYLSYLADGKHFVTGTYEGNCKIITLPDEFFEKTK